MPRKLPKSGVEQFVRELERHETLCRMIGAGEGDYGKLSREIGTVRNKLIKLFEARKAHDDNI
jgi:hypothetical protein